MRFIIEISDELPDSAQVVVRDIDLVQQKTLPEIAFANEDECRYWVERELPRVKGWYTFLNDARVEEKAEALNICRRVDAKYNPVLSLLTQLERRIKEAYTGYRKKREIEHLRVEAERRRIDMEQREQDIAALIGDLEAQGRHEEASVLRQRMTDMVPYASVASAYAPKYQNSTVRKRAKWEVVDLSLIPREYLSITPDKKRIEARVRTFGVEADIPGVRVWIDEEIASRSIAPGS